MDGRHLFICREIYFVDFALSWSVNLLPDFFWNFIFDGYWLSTNFTVDFF
jgi:hypothetical protein